MIKAPDPIDVRVGQKLRDLRKTAGMSQSLLAQQLGVTFQQVQKYEKGTNRMGSSRLAHAAAILGVRAEDLFGENTIAPDSMMGDFEVLRLVHSEECRELNGYFVAIRSPKVRRAVIHLVKAMAMDQK